METRNQTDFFTSFHYLCAWFPFEKLTFTKYVDKYRIYLSFFPSLFYCCNLAVNDLMSLFFLGFSFGNSMCATKSSNYINHAFQTISHYLYYSQHFYFCFSIQAISWFNLHSCGSKLAHSACIFLKMLDQWLQRWIIDLLRRVTNSKSFIINIDISFAIKFHVKLSWTISCKKCVSMSIDQSRKSNKFGTIFLCCECYAFSFNPF